MFLVGRFREAFDYSLPETHEIAASMIYFEMLMINPFKLSVSFASVPDVDKSNLYSVLAIPLRFGC